MRSSSETLTCCSGFGHDKSLTIRPYAQLAKDQRPTLFYAGDGVSDLSAARETDLLFAKKGKGKSHLYRHRMRAHTNIRQILLGTA